MSQSKTHTVLLKVAFDKPCSKTAAVKVVRDNIHGTFYPACWKEGDPEVMKIKGVSPAKEG